MIPLLYWSTIIFNKANVAIAWYCELAGGESKWCEYLQVISFNEMYKYARSLHKSVTMAAFVLYTTLLKWIDRYASLFFFYCFENKLMTFQILLNENW